MGKRTIIVPVAVEVDTGDYELNYGRADDIEAFTREIVLDASSPRFDLLGWGTVLPADSDAKYRALHGSEVYAAGRMTHTIIRDQKFAAVQAEVVHDALMAAFQAGYIAAAEGVAVDDLLARMASL